MWYSLKGSNVTTIWNKVSDIFRIRCISYFKSHVKVLSIAWWTHRSGQHHIDTFYIYIYISQPVEKNTIGGEGWGYMNIGKSQLTTKSINMRGIYLVLPNNATVSSMVISEELRNSWKARGLFWCGINKMLIYAKSMEWRPKRRNENLTDFTVSNVPADVFVLLGILAIGNSDIRVLHIVLFFRD